MTDTDTRQEKEVEKNVETEAEENNLTSIIT
jgi:hypothetical protein